jgi:PBP1b-binding outer membrane lipoprotein LpoB
MRTASILISIIAIILGLSSCSGEDSFRTEKEEILPVKFSVFR